MQFNFSGGKENCFTISYLQKKKPLRLKGETDWSTSGLAQERQLFSNFKKNCN